MFSADEIRMLQGDAESEMKDTFAAFSPGEPTTDADGYKVPGWNPEGTTLGKTQGGARQSRDAAPRRVTIGGVDFEVIEGGLQIPILAFIDDATSALRLRAGWQFQCIAISPRTDPAQLGRRWHVDGVPTKAIATARRLDVAEVPPLALD